MTRSLQEQQLWKWCERTTLAERQPGKKERRIGPGLGESRRKPPRKDTWQSFFPPIPPRFCGGNNAGRTDLNYAHLVDSGMETVRDRVCCHLPISLPKSSNRSGEKEKSCSEHLDMNRGRRLGEIGVGCLILELC